MREAVTAERSHPFGAWIAGWALVGAVADYWRDACERSTLFLDVLRERGNNYRERSKQAAPHVLDFAGELIMDGRTLPRPVNYGLVRIVPPEGMRIDERKRPFIIFDPRAGHGPGIGGMKHESEIGVALQAGHSCYFVGFLPAPMPGQTVGDVCAAEARFIEAVIARHPDAEGRPVLIGNCQAGWQIMITAAVAPDLPGPIMLAGSPLSYWAGVHGRNPMRYLGGLLGGTWLTALAGDLGHGIFDGANLVANFEALHPANTYWKKAYDLYSKVDSEASRFLEFEKWWGNPVLLNAEEMQTIADELFVGNKLTSGELTTPQGLRIDLRNIRSPIIVFCSKGDDITPPQQALHWITDLYEHENEIVANGQTIVYCLHQTIGHLGIFVSGKVASREHGEFARAMDLIDITPPGLYEAVIEGLDDSVTNLDLVRGDYLFQLQRRTLDDIRAIGGNSVEDDMRFATVARISDINLGLYRSTLTPFVRLLSTAQSAEQARRLHPNRIRFELFSDANPFMSEVARRAAAVRVDRHPASPDNPLTLMERAVSDAIVQNLELWTQLRDTLQETIFLTTYGSPWLQALAGLGAKTPMSGRRIQRDLYREATAARLADERTRRIDKGGLLEAGVRAALYVSMAEGRIDERAYAALEQIAAEQPRRGVGLAGFKEVVRDQYMMLLRDEERVIAALPNLLPSDHAPRAKMLDIVRRLVTARGALPPEGERRFARIATMFDAGDTPRAAGDGRLVPAHTAGDAGDR